MLDYNISPPRMGSVEQARIASGIPAPTIRRWYAEGKIVGVKSGRRILINIDRLFDYLNTHTERDERSAVPVSGIRPIKVR